MLTQMDPTLISFCDKIAAQGPCLQLADDADGSNVSAVPVAQLASVTRASARLRNAQPEVNPTQSYEALKRQKNHTGIEIFCNISSVSVNSDHPTKFHAQLLFFLDFLVK